MKTFIFTILLIFTTSLGFSQNEDVRGNKINSKEIAPTWPGCEESSLSKSKCFQQRLTQHIQQNFKFPKGYSAADKGSRVIVTFVINKEGKPEIENVEGGSEILQEEAKRNILLLPKMTPGSLNGKPRAIEFKVPFNF